MFLNNRNFNLSLILLSAITFSCTSNLPNEISIIKDSSVNSSATSNPVTSTIINQESTSPSNPSPSATAIIIKDTPKPSISGLSTSVPIASPSPGVKLSSVKLTSSAYRGFDLYTMNLNDQKTKLITKVGHVLQRNGSTVPELISNGKFIFSSVVGTDTNTSFSRILIMNEDGKNPQILADADIEFDISKDGKKILFEVLEKNPENFNKLNRSIYSMNLDGTEKKFLLHTKVIESRTSYPRWTPDGNSISYINNPGGVEDETPLYIYIADKDGKNSKQIYEFGVAGYLWSHDGSKLITKPLFNGQNNVIMNKDGSSRQVIKISDFKWSFDDKKLFYSNSKGLFSLDVDSNNATSNKTNIILSDDKDLANSNTLTEFAITDNKMFFIKTVNYKPELFSCNFDGSEVKQITKSEKNYYISGVSLSNDKTQLIYRLEYSTNMN